MVSSHSGCKYFVWFTPGAGTETEETEEKAYGAFSSSVNQATEVVAQAAARQVTNYSRFFYIRLASFCIYVKRTT